VGGGRIIPNIPPLVPDRRNNMYAAVMRGQFFTVYKNVTLRRAAYLEEFLLFVISELY
jgi:hypothetical protein